MLVIGGTLESVLMTGECSENSTVRSLLTVIVTPKSIRPGIFRLDLLINRWAVQMRRSEV